MHALVYFRRKGDMTYRALGAQDVKTLPPLGCNVMVDVDGTPTRARVMDRRESISREHQTPLDLSLYLQGVVGNEETSA